MSETDTIHRCDSGELQPCPQRKCLECAGDKKNRDFSAVAQIQELESIIDENVRKRVAAETERDSEKERADAHAGEVAAHVDDKRRYQIERNALQEELDAAEADLADERKQSEDMCEGLNKILEPFYGAGIGSHDSYADAVDEVFDSLAADRDALQAIVDAARKVCGNVKTYKTTSGSGATCPRFIGTVDPADLINLEEAIASAEAATQSAQLLGDA